MRIRRYSKKQRTTGIAALLITLIVALVQHYGWIDDARMSTVSTDPGHYRVERYIDGDTIAVVVNGKHETVRLIGVDTPETHRPNSPVQCYGPAASSYTKTRIQSQGGMIQLTTDNIGDDRDRYDRLLRYVLLPDGVNLNQELIAKGYGFAYTSFPFSKSTEFKTAQRNAQAKKLGLWSGCSPHVENNGRWQSNDI